MLDSSTENIFAQEPKFTKQINGFNYVCVDEVTDAQNPFVLNPYDYDSGFYQGDFSFVSSLDGRVYNSTPETFGRHRAASALLRLLNEGRVTVLDIGCGTLDVARLLPPETLNDDAIMINSDISGPWSVAGGMSSLERGTSKLDQAMMANVLNVQYDFNISDWPFNSDCLDVAVTNMALHHLHPDRKKVFLDDIKRSLKPGATIIITDVFNKDESGVRFTESGKRGPEECGGYLEPVSSFIQRAISAGLVVDKVAEQMAIEGRNYQLPEELSLSKKDPKAIMAINKAIWYMEFRNVA